MKRAKHRHLTSRERWQLTLTVLLVTTAAAVTGWVQFRDHEFSRPKDLLFGSEPEVRVPLAEIPTGKARIARVADPGSGAAVSLFASRQASGFVAVTLAECRRCRQAARPSYVRNGRLICGHCAEPMPLLQPGQVIGKQPDCTPIPVTHTVDGAAIVVRAEDWRASLKVLRQDAN
ncbi:MAG: Fe-S-containing protein [Bryobacteraceae bacterium]|jgi:uncharacterized membrane protein|nr:Fe-S-containing protein [Bryobacteraceae bacterium]